VPKKIFINLNTAWNLLNFRAGLIRALLASGYEVIAVAPHDKYVAEIEELGCRFIHLEMDIQGTHPVRDFLLICRYVRLLKNEQPDVCLFFTVKPNVFGSLASAFCGIPYINNVAGLGTVFIQRGWLMWLVSFLYKLAFKNSAKVFFQNNDDLELFIEKKLVYLHLTDILPGSGIDLNRFSPLEYSERKSLKSPFRFLLIARMLVDKGVVEYINAAEIIRKNGLQIECCLLGFLDVQNPAAISSDQMKIWTDQGIVNYLGECDDVRVHISQADCIVLPSYREGLPRSLLEAAAMAKPIITTNVPGCKDVVVDGINGFICEAKNTDDLASKMTDMFFLSEEQRKKMGENGRMKIVREFDEKLVIQKYLCTIANI
jgi:glycosyltransferase involved in cell wall biosynthesis